MPADMMDTGRARRVAGAYYRPLRAIFLATSDAFIVFMSLVVSIFLYTRGIPLPFEWRDIFAIFGWLFGAQLVAFAAFRVHRVSFHYANVLAAVKIAAILALTWGLTFIWLRQWYGGLWPPTIAALQALLAIVGAITFRLLGLIYLEVRRLGGSGDGRLRAVIYGAGQTGMQLALALGDVPELRILGFLDDAPRLRGQVIYGYHVLESFDRLERLMLTQTIDQVIVAIPSLDGERLRQLRRRCRELKVSVKVIPPISEVYSRPPEALALAVREPALEDLLRREARPLPVLELQTHFSGMRALVVGGAGSIGSELVNQLLRLGCAGVAVVDASELGLYQLEQRHEGNPRLTLHMLDAKDRVLLERVFAAHRPDVVFHAAAYKHVHLVEQNPVPAVLNNVAAVRAAADLAHEHGARQFVFVSTDKAVRPESVMGQTKRLGELYVRGLDGRSDTAFFTVRFGNVVGSSGSLIPKIVDRVARGLPIEITHPDMQRYFMLIPEAVSLILESCLQARGGELFVLDMGKPIRIADLVHDVIRLLERRPGTDVPIHYSQPRPGEKLTEDLFDPDLEHFEKRSGMYVAFGDLPSYDVVQRQTERLLQAATLGHEREVRVLLREAVSVPFAPQEHKAVG
jgi:FlaA1/EpsC-like NDP-sugar epimerase